MISNPTSTLTSSGQSWHGRDCGRTFTSFGNHSCDAQGGLGSGITCCAIDCDGCASCVVVVLCVLCNWYFSTVGTTKGFAYTPHDESTAGFLWGMTPANFEMRMPFDHAIN